MNDKKLMNIFTLIAIPFFILGLLISMLVAYFFGTYNVNIHPISELGSTICTPYPIIMNATFILSAFFLSFYFFNLYKIVSEVTKNSRFYYSLSNLGFSLIMIMLIGLICSAIISVDISRDIHNLFTVLVFVPLLFGELIIGLVILKLNIFQRYLAIIMAFGHIIVSLLYFFVHTPLLEWLMFFILLMWGAPLSMKMFKINQSY